MCLRKKKNLLRYFDIFAPPYKQKINQDHYEKKTTLGGVLSILIILASLSYFTYLITLFYQRKFQPKFSSFDKFAPEQIEYIINSDQFIIILQTSDKRMVSDIELKSKKQYFDIFLRQKDEEEDKAVKLINSYIDGNDDFTAYVFGKDKNQELTMNSHIIPFFGSNLTIQVNKCTAQNLREGYECASEQEYNEMMKLSLIMQVLFSDSTFSTKENDEIDRHFIQLVIKSSGETNGEIFLLKLQQTEVSQGFFLQENIIYNNIYDIEQQSFTMKEEFFPRDDNDENEVISIIILIDNTIRITQIQYPQLSEIIAQAWSTISLILLSGYLVKFMAQSTLAQDFLAIQLKYYYKKTAQKLFNQEQKDHTNEGQRDSDPNNVLKQVESIVKKNEEIQNASFKRNFKKYFNISEYEKWKIFFFPKYCLKRRKKVTQESILLDNLMNQTNQDMSVFEMQKEILKIKTIIKLLLTPEQYAAIQMCGCDLIHPTDDGYIPPLQEQKNEKSPVQIQLESVQNQDISQQGQYVLEVSQESQISNNLYNSPIIQPQQKHTLNHLEQMNRVDIDPIFKKQCLEKFLIEENGNEDLAFNNRIKNCMIGIEQDQNKIYLQNQQSQYSSFSL